MGGPSRFRYMRIETFVIRVTNLKPLLRLVFARHKLGVRYLVDPAFDPWDQQSREK